MSGHLAAVSLLYSRPPSSRRPFSLDFQWIHCITAPTAPGWEQAVGRADGAGSNFRQETANLAIVAARPLKHSCAIHFERRPLSDSSTGDYRDISAATEYPIGITFDVVFKEFSVTLTTLAGCEMLFHIANGPFARTEKVGFDVSTLRPGVFLVSWQEASRATVVHLEDFVQMVIYSYATLPDGSFLKMQGPIRMAGHGGEVAQ